MKLIFTLSQIENENVKLFSGTPQDLNNGLPKVIYGYYK